MTARMGSDAVFMNHDRGELKKVDSCPQDSSVRYHALIGEKGPGHERFREFIQFHNERTYAEYLVAYNVV